MGMANEEIISPSDARFNTSRGAFRAGRPQGAVQGPVIDQEGLEITPGSLRSGVRQFQFDFGHSSTNPFGNLTREQRLARFEILAKLLDVAFIVPGTKI